MLGIDTCTCRKFYGSAPWGNNNKSLDMVMERERERERLSVGMSRVEGVYYTEVVESQSQSMYSID